MQISVKAFGALAVLIKSGESRDVAKFRRRVEDYEGDRPPIALISAASELSLVSNTSALPEIGRLSGSRFLSVQLAAMTAIRHIADVRSIPVLIERLDDRNESVQYSAVITLAEILQKSGDYGPDIELFKKDRLHYIRRWKQWWVDEGSKSYSPAQN